MKAKEMPFLWHIIVRAPLSCDDEQASSLPVIHVDPGVSRTPLVLAGISVLALYSHDIPAALSPASLVSFPRPLWAVISP